MCKWLKKYWFVFCLVLFFLFFLYISRYAPVVGDDWGYAATGRYTNPIVKAWQNYLSWSGRFLSELWGFAIAPHKKLWNILNSLIFTSIYGLLFKLSKNKKYPVFTAGLAVLLIVSVANRLRMQTYTWIMGTTYVIPLLLFFIYVSFLFSYIFENNISKFRMTVMLLCNACIPLFMENAAAMLVGSNVLVFIYLWFKDKRKLITIGVFTVISVIGTMIIKFSPGAIYRMNRDHAAFNELSIFEKIATNWESFIKMTFTNNTWVICILSIVNCILVYQKVKTNTKWIVIVINILGILPVFMDLSLLIESIIYILYTCGLFYSACTLRDEENEKWFIIYLIFVAGGANIVMLISPIFDSRSSIYTVYCFILIILNLLNRIEISDKIEKLTVVITTVVIGVFGFRYFELYRIVHWINIKRESEIAYYQERPDTELAYVIAYPDESIHSGNAEPDDSYHMEAFKEYYYLNENMTVRFYYLKEYTYDTIFGTSD